MDDRITVSALFPSDVQMDTLRQSLREAGVPDEAVSVMTPLPLSEKASAHVGFLPLYVITILAGLVGIGIGLFFAGGTAVMYPLMTGGKPIVAAPVLGIIAYETMMLLAIVATFAASVLTIRRCHRHIDERDTRIDDGHIVCSITVSPHRSSVSMIRLLLQRAGALEVSPPSAATGSEGPESPRQVAAALFVVLCMLATVSACSRDMQEQPSYQPQESPRLHSPVGSVPRDSRAALSVKPAQNADGERLFRINCAHCHGMGGTGDGPVAHFLKEKPANLRSPRVEKLPESSVYDIVTDGKDVMPPFKGELSADERRTVAAYVKSLAGQ